MMAMSEEPPIAPVMPTTVDRSLKKMATVMQESTMTTVTKASFQYSTPHASLAVSLVFCSLKVFTMTSRTE